MTEFTALELNRVIQMLPITDPSTSAYHNLLHSLESLACNVEAIDMILGEIEMWQRGIVKVEFAPLGKNEEAKAEEPEPAPPMDNVVDINTVKDAGPAEEVDLVTMRRAMKDAKRRGIDIVAAVKEFGGTNLTDLSKDQWPALLKRLEESE